MNELDNNKHVVTAMTVKMRVEIISTGQDILKGELHSMYLETPFEFVNLLRMIDKMEEIFDTYGFPQKYMKTRSFSDQKEKSKGQMTQSSVLKDSITAEISSISEGTKNSFDIYVRHRDNATWQGQIHWLEKDTKQDFNCVLDIIRLIDIALMDGVENKKPIDWGM